MASNETKKEYYIGLDVSQKNTSICIIDSSGKIIREGGSLTRPVEIYGWIKNRLDLSDKSISVKVALEAGNLSSWLYTGLNKLGLVVYCLETFQAHRYLATFRNKTDKNDARGLAQMLRIGGEDHLRLVVIRSQISQQTRTLLHAREQLVRQKVGLENNIAGLLKPYGVIVARGSSCPHIFYDRVIDGLCLLEDKGTNLKDIIKPSLRLYMEICDKLEPLTKQVEEIANNDDICKRLMQIPGVGAITAVSFYAAVDNPERFKKSSDVGAYFGLTPRQYQSGDVNYTTGISKRGDLGTRKALVNAATVLLSKSEQWSSLKVWGIKLAKRIGYSKARIAVARKLAIIMHKIWLKKEKFKPKLLKATELVELKQKLGIANKNPACHINTNAIATT